MSSGPAHRVQSAVVEYGFPQGHLGHLTPDEEAALGNFKKLCAEKGLYKPGNGADEPASHEDATLLRFLRARRFVVSDAIQQFADTEAWREANQLDQLYETIDLEQYEETRRLYPQWTGRRDRRGIPVYVFEVKHLNAKRMAAYEKSAIETHSLAKTDGKTPGKLLRLFALYENLVRFVMPLCTVLTDREHPNTPITQSNNIVDISGVGLKQFWNLRGHMQDASTLATAHYPETLDRIFIIGAPAFFPTVWGWIKKWFDPITTSKIFILSAQDMKTTLESFIDPKNIPKKYGGELEFEFGDMPTLDPALAAVTSWKGETAGFPGGPLYWIPTKDGQSIEAIAVGSSEQKERREVVCTVKKPQRDTEIPSTTSEPTTTEPPATRPEFLQAPTATPSIATTTAGTDTPATSEPTKEEQELAIQNGEVIPASRPELETFHTAADGLNTLSLNEKDADTQSLPNGTAGTHTTATANLLDPKVNTLDGAADLEKAPTQQEEIHDEKAPAQPEPVPAPAPMVANKPRAETEPLPARSEKAGVKEKGEKRKSLLGKVKEKVHL
ncbi:phosphatidylinositol transporter protein [Rutstroemia sp. NJR-2017a WRK4]|nr:phosphatidylinositol transporter protein [Rutstroemia sp. NJR-2017a WRK4]